MWENSRFQASATRFRWVHALVTVFRCCFSAPVATCFPCQVFFTFQPEETCRHRCLTGASNISGHQTDALLPFLPVTSDCLLFLAEK